MDCPPQTVTPRPPVEIVNLGLPRYFAESEKLMLEHYGLPYKPDLITVGFAVNDIVDTHFGLEALTINRRGAIEFNQDVIKKKGKPLWDEVYKKNGAHEDDWQELLKHYTEMADMAKQAGIKMVVISIPKRGPWKNWHHIVDRRLEEWAADKDWVYVVPVLQDMRRLEKENPDKPLYYSKDFHCTPFGYSIIADATYNFIEKHKLIP